MLRGSASGFVVAGTRPTGASPRSIATGDFNRDGRPDFAVANRIDSSVTVLSAHRDSVVPDVWGELAAGAGARGIVAGDFDSDGRVDIAVASQLEGRLDVFENSTAFIRTGLAFGSDEIRVPAMACSVRLSPSTSTSAERRSSIGTATG
jgi:VCBS repeat protein